MTEAAVEVVWQGADALRPFLVPIDQLEPFPGNPRRGDVEELRASLRRFGQVMPVLADPQFADGEQLRIVARHHLILAATEEGWSHMAVIPNEFADEEEARAFLIGDNRWPELGGYDTRLLVEHLQALAEQDRLPGTGYTTDDLDDRLAELQRQLAGGDPGPRPDPAPPTTHREVVLIYSPEQHAQFDEWQKLVAREKGTDGVSETIYAALEVAADAING